MTVTFVVTTKKNEQGDIKYNTANYNRLTQEMSIEVFDKEQKPFAFAIEDYEAVKGETFEGEILGFALDKSDTYDDVISIAEKLISKKQKQNMVIIGYERSDEETIKNIADNFCDYFTKFEELKNVYENRIVYIRK